MSSARSRKLRERRYASGDLRRAVYQRARGRCEYCGARVSYEDGNSDHITPFLRGGYTTLKNLAWCCRSCNQNKGNRTPQEWQPLKLKKFRKGEPVL